MSPSSLARQRPRLVAAAAALSALAAFTVAAPSPSADAARCTIKGTNGPDRLVGTSGNDVICGLGGDDVIFTGGGREDILLGGDGDDRLVSDDTTFSRLEGGAGNDRLEGGSRTDSLVGGGGRDVLLGGGGNDGLYGGGGDDQLDGEGGSDSMRWEPGADRIKGGTGADRMGYGDAPGKVHVTLDGTANDGTADEHDNVADDVEVVGGSLRDDVLTGNGDPNTFYGYNGEDRISGGGGRDTLYGDQDDDELRGGAGNDTLVGGDSDDLLIGGDGADVLKGAGGNTQSSESNACDEDPADTVTRCKVDGAGPIFYATLDQLRFAPGDTFSFSEVRVVDASGVPGVRLSTTYDGVEVAWCSGQMKVEYPGPGGTAALVNKTCHVPDDAPEGAYELVFSGTDRLGHAATSDDGDRRYGFMVDTTPDAAPPSVTTHVAKATYAPGDRVKVTVDTQDVDGVTYEYVQLLPPSGGWGCPETSALRTSGTMADGTWTFTCRLPQAAVSGTWTVSVQAGDTWDHTAFLEEAATFTVTG